MTTQHQAPEVTSVVVPLSIWNAVVGAAQAYADFAAARESMNAARPAISATRAEYALYDERYKADHEAERKHWTTAIELAQVAEQIVAASTDDNATRATQPLSLTVDEEMVDRAAMAISLADANHDYDALGKSNKDHYRRMARAALGSDCFQNGNSSGTANV